MLGLLKKKQDDGCFCVGDTPSAKLVVTALLMHNPFKKYTQVTALGNISCFTSLAGQPLEGSGVILALNRCSWLAERTPAWIQL